MRGQQSPLVEELDQDCIGVVDELKNIDERYREQNTKLKNVGDYLTKITEAELRNEWEGNYKRLEVLYQEAQGEIRLMNEIKALFMQKKKIMMGGNQCPPEIIGKLVDKVLEWKKERIRFQEEMKDIDEELEEIRKVNIGEAIDLRSKNKVNDADRSRFITQIPYLSPEKLKKKPKEFIDYLTNYEAELAKSLLQVGPGSQEFKQRMFELGKVSEMKHLFSEAQTKQEQRDVLGYDPVTIRGAAGASFTKQPQQPNLKLLDAQVATSAGLSGVKNQLDSLGNSRDRSLMDARDEELVRLQQKVAKMNETIRGLDLLNKEKEKVSLLQKEKFDMLEKERYEVEINRLKLEREREEADHLKRLQKMNLELEYIEQLKLKTVGIVANQLEEFGKVEENRWATKRMRDKEFHQEELNRLQAEFMMREERRQRQFEQQMKELGSKYDKALQLIEGQTFNPDSLKDLLREVKQGQKQQRAGRSDEDPGRESDFSEESGYDGDRYSRDMRTVLRKYGDRQRPAKEDAGRIGRRKDSRSTIQ